MRLASCLTDNHVGVSYKVDEISLCVRNTNCHVAPVLLQARLNRCSLMLLFVAQLGSVVIGKCSFSFALSVSLKNGSADGQLHCAHLVKCTSLCGSYLHRVPPFLSVPVAAAFV